MKKMGICLIAILFSFFCFTDAFAQRGMKWQGSGNWGPGSPYNRMFDPKTVGTITGEVVRVELSALQKGMSPGVHLIIKTSKETIPVHLGPAWYLERQDIKIEPKETVEVTGSRIVFEGKPAIIASEAKTKDGIIRLRDENGFPVWSGWRRR